MINLAEAKSFVSTGRWRGYLPPEDYHHINNTVQSIDTWTAFWIATKESEVIPHHTQATIRCMFLSELVIDSYQSSENNSVDVSLERDETDAFAVPIDAVYYPLELVAASVDGVDIVDEEDDSSVQCESISAPSSYQYLIDLVGDNRERLLLTLIQPC
jgi:hypothetical protein